MGEHHRPERACNDRNCSCALLKRDRPEDFDYQGKVGRAGKEAPMKKILSGLLVSTLVLSSAGCAGMTDEQQRAVSGGAMGAAGGAALGAITGGSAAIGAAIGGVAGVAGGLIYNEMKKDKKKNKDKKDKSEEK
jgi:osmotically inducible lipoprotein OsmB